MAERRYIGVLLAAGKSSRMGRTKQLMAWNVGEDENTSSESADEPSPQPSPTPGLGRGSGSATTVVEASFDTIAPHCAEMVVVLGHDAPAVIQTLEPRKFEIVISDPFAEMLNSIRLGLVAAQRIGEGRGVILHLADVPAAPQEIVQNLIDTSASNAGKAVMPEFRGEGGHPVIIPAKLIHPIVTWKGDGGLREFWRKHPTDVIRVPVDSMPGATGVVRDLDVPADFER